MNGLNRKRRAGLPISPSFWAGTGEEISQYESLTPKLDDEDRIIDAKIQKILHPREIRRRRSGKKYAVWDKLMQQLFERET